MISHLFEQFAVFLGRDLGVLLRWELHLLLLGLAALPLTRRLLPFRLDGGYPFAKVLGMILPTYALWLTGHLGMGTFRLLPAWSAVAFVGVCSAVAVRFLPLDHAPGWHEEVRSLPWQGILAEELLFFAALTLWAFVRGFQPAIEGLEKFMDFGFVNAVLRSEGMPPPDMWLAGETVNYYYFGHATAAFLTAFSGTPPAYAYNLMIATLFAFTLLGSFSLAAHLAFAMPCCTAACLRNTFRPSQETKVRRGLSRLRLSPSVRRALLAGWIAALLVTVGGNVHTFLYAYAHPALKTVGLFEGEVKSYWYPDATRYIGYNPPTKDKTIHEFPSYSFVVADLHGHVSDIPVVLTGVALTLGAFLEGASPLRTGAMGLLLGIMYMTNAWDFPIYLALWTGALVVRGWKRRRFWRGLAMGVGSGVAAGAVALGTAGPFLATFQNFAQGVLPVMARSPWTQLLVLWGDKLFNAYCFLVFLLAGLFRALARKPLGQHLARWWRRLPRSDLFAAGLCLGALALVITPELIYVKDIYGVEFHRANTMFKLGYQAFILFGLASGYIMVRIVSSLQGGRKLFFAGLFALLVAMPLCFPDRAVMGYYNLQNPYNTLDGLAFLRERGHAGDYGAVQWLSEHVRGPVPVLEADGDSYTLYGRISMATGLPTVLGWYVHEWLWHNNSELSAKRREQVATLYNAPGSPEAAALREKYGVRYITLGALEKTRFPQMDEAGLRALGPVVFSQDQTAILRVEEKPAAE